MTRLDSGTLEKPELETRTGVLVVDKPSGPTSHDVVHQARRLFQTRAIGHAGTLDPMATGVLLLLVGEATKLAPFLTLDKKRYLARITFGTSTDTLDAEGIEIDRVTLAPGLLTRARIERALDVERARTTQVPPSVSAIKVDGQCAHRIHRKGRAVELAPRSVRLHEATLVTFDDTSATFDLWVSKGYYVRALARDLGQAIGTPAHVSRLRRVASGAFSIDEAARWPANDDVVFKSLVEAAGAVLELARLTQRGTERARKGQRIASDDFVGRPPRADVAGWLDEQSELVAIGSRNEDGTFRVKRGFRPSG
jgi:tRNA pseudouridine55 synthase